MLAALAEERQFSEQHQKNKVRRVKIEKVNQAWLVRFLPVGLGERNLWFVRLGQHWMNRQPIICPKCVSQDFGGDPNAECPVCEMAELLNAEDNEAVSNYGYKLKASLTYLTHCLVYQIDPGRGEVQEMSEDEVLKPYEFQHYRSSFEELMDYFRRGVTASRPFSVLDLEKGNDFWATRTTKGTRLDRQDPGPVFDLSDPNYEQKIDRVWAAISQPRIKIPSLKELDTFARKAEAAAGDTEPSSGHSRNDRRDESDDMIERPERRRAPAPGRRMAAESVDSVADDDQIPGAEVPGPAPARSASAGRTAPAPARSASAGRPAPAAAAAAGRPASTAATGRPAPAAAAAAGRPASAVAGRPVTRPASAAQSSVDAETEDPGVAEEASDAAPPAEHLPPEDTQDEQSAEDVDQGAEEAEGAEDDQEAPPARPANAVPSANAGLRQRLISRVKRA